MTRALSITVVALALVAVFLHRLGPVVDYDLWFHLRMGEEIARTHSVPHTTSFLAIDFPPHYTLNDEYGFRLLCWEVYRALGVPGLACLLSALIAAIWLAIFLAARAGGLSTLPALATCLLADQVMQTRFALRPQLMTDLFLALMLALLLKAERSSARWLYPIPVLIAIWSNFHAGVILGVGVLGLWWLTQLYRPRIALKPFTIVTALGVLAMMARPDGWKLPAYVHDVFSRTATLQWIQEWEPLTRALPHWLTGPIGLLLAAAVVAFALRPRLPYIAVGLALTRFAFQHVRAVGELGAGLPPLVGAALADRFPVLSREPGPRWLALNAALLVAILVMVAPKQPIAYGPSPDIYPAGAARFLTLHPPPGPVFCSYQFGSYLVFERVPAYFHTMTTTYPDSVLLDYFALRDHPEKLAEIVGRYKLGGFLLHYEYFDDQHRLIEALQRDPAWSLVYFDNLCVLYMPASLGLPAYHQLNPALAIPLGPNPQEELARYTSENPHVARGWMLQALYWHSQNRPEDEMKAYNQAIEADPDNVQARLARATLRFQAKDFEGALEDARKAVELAPQYPPAHYNLAVALAQTGDVQAARRELTKTLELDPHFESAATLRDRLP